MVKSDKKMIAIRYRPLRKGEYSIYLDIYSVGKRERKFTGLRSSKDYSKTKFISKEDVGAVEKARKMVKEFSGEMQVILSTNPLPEYKYIKHSNDRPFLTNAEIEALSTTSIANPFLRLAFFFSLHSGLTWKQATTLIWEQIKVEKQGAKKKEKWSISINGYLNHAVYTNELSDSAVEILKEAVSIKVSPEKIRLANRFQTEKNVYINVNELSGNVFKHLPNRPDVDNGLHLWGAMAGIGKNIRFSMARNTYAMNQVEKGVRKQQLKRLLNVSRASNVSIYERMSENIAYDKSSL